MEGIIFTYIYHKNQVNVGKYTSPMDPMGYWAMKKKTRPKTFHLILELWLFNDGILMMF